MTKEHVTNHAGDCVPMCPACREMTKAAPTSNLRSLLDEAIAAMSALHESAEPQTDHPEIPALIPAQAFRTFVDAHARLLYGRAHLPVETAGVQVAGDTLPTALWQFEQRASVLLSDEQTKANPDNALIGFICDAVRLARENERLARSPLEPEPPHTGIVHAGGPHTIHEGSRAYCAICSSQKQAWDCACNKPECPYCGPRLAVNGDGEQT